MASRRPLIARGERAPDCALPVAGQAEAIRCHGLVGGRRVTAGAGSDAGSAGWHLPRPGRVREASGVTCEDAPVVVVLDPDLRVLDAMPVDDVETTREDVVGIVPGPRDDDGASAPRLAPVLLVPDALAGALPTGRGGGVGVLRVASARGATGGAGPAVRVAVVRARPQPQILIAPRGKPRRLGGPRVVVAGRAVSGSS